MTQMQSIVKPELDLGLRNLRRGPLDEPGHAEVDSCRGVKVQGNLPQHHACRSLHNTRALIHRLPVELLVEIVFNQSRISHFCDHWSFAELMRVCRYWRAIALDTPLLWAKIARGANIPFLRLALQRGRQAPAQITFEYHKSWSKSAHVSFESFPLPPVTAAFIIALHEHASHISRLNITTDHYIPLDLAPFHCLESLQIAAFNEASGLPLHLSSTVSSKLRTISTNGSIQCDESSFHALSSLHLWNVLDTISLSQLLRLLPGLPNLQSLHINVIDIASRSFWCKKNSSSPPLTRNAFDDSSERLAKVSVPYLRELRICDPYADTALSILDHLAVSSQSVLYIDLARGSFGNGTTTLHHICSIFQRSRDALPAGLHEGRLSVERQDWDNDVLFRVSATDREDWSISLGVAWFDDKWMADALSTIAQVFSSMPIVDMHVNLSVDWTICRLEDWRTIFTSMPALVALHTKARDDRADLWHALGSLQPSEPSESLLLPHLRDIRYEVTRPPIEDVIKAIQSSLAFRNSRGFHLSKLAIAGVAEDMAIAGRTLDGSQLLETYVDEASCH